MPDFSNLATTVADFGIATTAMPLDFNVPTTAVFDDLGLATTGLPLDFGVPTPSALPDFDVPTTQPLNFGPATTQGALPMVATTQVFPGFADVTTATEELPLFDVQTTAAADLPLVTTESFFDDVPTTASFDEVTTEGLPMPGTTEGFDFAEPVTTGAFTTQGLDGFGMPTTNVPTFVMTGLPEGGFSTMAAPDFGFPTTPGFPEMMATTQGKREFSLWSAPWSSGFDIMQNIKWIISQQIQLKARTVSFVKMECKFSTSR